MHHFTTPLLLPTGVLAIAAALVCAALHMTAAADAPAASRQLQVNGALRLVGGHTESMGYLQAYVNGRWGTVCDDGFSTPEGQVACELLGYSELVGVSSGSSSMRVSVETDVSTYVVPVSSECQVPILWDDVICYAPISGSSVPRCTFRSREWGSENCSPFENVVLRCTSNSSELLPGTVLAGNPSGCTPSSTRFRLTGSNSSSYGRLEVSYDGSCSGQSISSIYASKGCSGSAPTGSIWGSVCDDSFGVSDAHAACMTMGFRGASELTNQAATDSAADSYTETMYPAAYRPDTSVPIVLDDVDCRTTTPQQAGGSILAACSTRTPGQHNCRHSEDVTLFCANSVPVQRSSIPSGSRSAPSTDNPDAPAGDDDSDDSTGSGGSSGSSGSSTSEAAGFASVIASIIPALVVVSIIAVAVRVYRARRARQAASATTAAVAASSPSPAPAPSPSPAPAPSPSTVPSVSVISPVSAAGSATPAPTPYAMPASNPYSGSAAYPSAPPPSYPPNNGGGPGAYPGAAPTGGGYPGSTPYPGASAYPAAYPSAGGPGAGGYPGASAYPSAPVSSYGYSAQPGGYGGVTPGMPPGSGGSDAPPPQYS